MGCIYHINGKPATLDEVDAYVHKIANSQFQKLRPEEIENKLKELHEIMDKDYKTETHQYFLGKEELKAVSRVLDDEFPGYGYDGQSGPAGDRASKLGSEVHLLLEKIIQGDTAFVKDSPLPESLKKQLQQFVDKLKAEKGSKLMTEVKVFDAKHNIAGTIDIVHVLKNGKVRIYDLKNALDTAARERQRAEGKSSGEVWNRSAHGGYKDKRYSGQLLLYSQILEEAGISVEDAFIVPVEINQDATEYKMRPAENIKTWEYYEPSRNHVNKFFGIERNFARKLGQPENTHDLLESILGEQFSEEHEVSERAIRSAYDNPGQNGKRGFYSKLKGSFVPYTRSGEKNQLEEIRKDRQKFIEKTRTQLAPAIIAYLKTGKDESLPPGYNEDMKALVDRLLAPYLEEDGKLRRGVEVYTLADKISGMSNNTDIIAIQEGDVIDLVQVGINHNKKYEFPNKSKNVFGRFMSDYQAEKAGIRLGNTRKDAQLLRLGLILPHLKQVFPDMEVGRILSMDLTQKGNSAVGHESVQTLIPQVQAVLAHQEISGRLSQEMKDMYAAMDSEGYKQDYARTLLGFLRSSEADTLRMKPKGKYKLEHKLQLYLDGKAENEEVLEILRDRLQKVMDHHTYNNIPAEEMHKDKEFLNISFAIFQLQGVSQLYNIEDMGSLDKWATTKDKVHVPVLKQLAKLIDSAVNKVRNAFFMKYKNDSDRIIERLIKDHNRRTGDMGPVRDRLVGGSSRYFEPLLKTYKDTASGREVNTMELLQPGDEGYDQLSDIQKEFIEWYCDRITDAWKNMLSPNQFEKKIKGPNYRRGVIPVIKKDYTERFFAGVVKGHSEEGRKMMKDAASSYFDRHMDFSDTNLQDRNVDPRKVPDAFSDQLSHTSRQILLGLETDKPLDVSKQEALETNLEVIMDVFQVNALRHKEMGRILPYVHSAQGILKTVGERGFMETSNEHATDMARRMGMMMVTGQTDRATDSSGRAGEKAWETAGHWAGIGLIGFNFISAVVSIGQIISGTITHTLSNKFTNGEMNSSFRNLFKALLTNVPGTQKGYKVDAVMKLYGMSSTDLNSMQRNFRKSDKRIFSTKWLFGMHQAGDYLARSAAMQAQMMHDGTWDAHQVVEKTLPDGTVELSMVYNEDLDPRFQAGRGKTQQEAEAFKAHLKKQLAKEGLLDENGRMLAAYDFAMRNQRKGYFDSIYDAFDTESRNNMQTTAIGRAFMMFKRFMIPKYNRLYKKRDTSTSSIYSGYKAREQEDGSVEYVWEDGTIEGTLQSLNGLFKEVKHQYDIAKGGGSWSNPYVTLEEFQKDNIRRLIADLVLCGLVTVLASAAFDDDDEDELARNILLRSVEDLSATYNPLTYLSLGATPFVSISYMQRVATAMTNLLTSPSAENADKSLGTTFSAYRQTTNVADIITED